MTTLAIDLPYDEIAAFCRRWKISELAIFDSAIRNDFRPTSDIDVLAAYADDAGWGLLDHEAMRVELERLLGRPVDLISRRALEHSQNWLRRETILKTAHTIYKAEPNEF